MDLGKAVDSVNNSESSRFAFGKNWQHFLNVLDEKRIQAAQESLLEMLPFTAQAFVGKSFLDAGSGSGLFSLAARRLGATVFSFDYDVQSVACTSALKQRYFPEDTQWRIEQGSVLDMDYLAQKGKFDIVYSWGVLHHTGAMWQAVENVIQLIKPEGMLYISIYNDQGILSRLWWYIKWLYNQLPNFLRLPYVLAIIVPAESILFSFHLLTMKPGVYLSHWTGEGQGRGMSRWHDNIDWIGGFPFEVAAPEAVIHFCTERGLTLVKQKLVGRGHGCNEFVFQKTSKSDNL